MSSTGNKGSDAEQRAAIFLQQQKLTLLERNYRCRFGEIDLIMREGDTVVFIEVKMRSSDRFGGAVASITAAKRLKLTRAARHYLAEHEGDLPCRFDAILISGEWKNEIEWIRNAFDEMLMTGYQSPSFSSN
ncbi:YraN family protein [Nitrosomonas sp. H1_AOB3]|uniref:YraN family protein n=1 Tax=Nitrosomonas sp. H1_AOB3 TaxID=2741553 RepID=UPI00193556C8|nr:YraN family protein [Nitrosomonas sp. H1_AOB3]QOJ08696.1 MAG: YraN family protein [Nitrosomonas sp. H1_AOB3]